MIKEDAWQVKFYKNSKQVVYAPGYFFFTHMRDPHSICIWESKKKDKTVELLPSVIKTLDELKTEGKLKDLDLITIVPSHKIGTFSPTLEPLGSKISRFLGVPFEKIIQRVKDTGESKGQKPDKRFVITSGSMAVDKEMIQSKNIKKVLLLDDIKSTGISILECRKILLEAGVVEIVCVCLGINCSMEHLLESTHEK